MLPTMAATEPGPLALVGSGAYLPSMLDVERALIDGNGTRRWPGGVHRDRPSVGLGARGRQARRLSVGDTLTLT
jgi:hypothetical protein